MPDCPACRRPLAVTRASCLYCGAPLPPAAVREPVAAEAADAGRATERVLIVLDLASVTVETLARATGRAPYDAALVARRAGLQLHRVLEPAAAEEEAERLTAAGIAFFSVSETAARRRPLRALGGEQQPGQLLLRTDEGRLAVRGEALLLVVSATIAREYRPSLQRRRVDTARLEDGFRVHLHPREDARPVEIDASNFELGHPLTGSTRLELEAWLREVSASVPRDDGFRLLPPAFAPAEPEPSGPLALAAALRPGSRRAAQEASAPGRRSDEPLVLDTLEQFRFYSGWRGAVERQRAGAAP